MINSCMNLQKYKRICTVCKIEFQAQRSTDTPKYCSPQCRINESLSKYHPCVECGTLIHPNKKFCTKSCSAKHNNISRGPRSESTKKKISDYAKVNPKGACDPSNKYKPKKKPRKSFKFVCMECKNDFYVMAVSKPKSKMYCSVECRNKNRYYPNSNRKHTSIVDGYKMDSGAEAYFAEFLNKNSISWIKNDGLKYKKSFAFVDSDGKNRQYYPDFYLPDHNIWVEIKGKRYIRKDDHLRRQAVDVPVYLLISNDFKYELEKFLTSCPPTN